MLACILMVCAVQKSFAQKSIVILYENDVHCAVDGYAKLAGLRDAIADTAYVALVSNGDYVQGMTVGAIQGSVCGGFDAGFALRCHHLGQP